MPTIKLTQFSKYQVITIIYKRQHSFLYLRLKIKKLALSFILFCYCLGGLDSVGIRHQVFQFQPI